MIRAGEVWSGYGYGRVQPEGGRKKQRKVYFGSETRKHYLCWQFVWTREDLNLSDFIEFNDSVKVLGVTDEDGYYAFQDGFGNTFQSFFIAYDNQDFCTAKNHYKMVRVHQNCKR